MTRQRQILVTVTYNDLGCIIDTKAEPYEEPNLQPTCNQLATVAKDICVPCKDSISRQAAIAVADYTDCTGLAIEDVKKVTDEVVKGLKQLPSAQTELTDDRAIEHLQSTGWMQNHDKEMYEMGLREQLADDGGSYDSLIPSGDTILRQAAIGAINQICPIDTEYDCALLDRVDVRCVLTDLPSVQPEPCEDAVSRQAVINIINKPVIIKAKEQIEALPSVQPERKTGKWIQKSKKLDLCTEWWYECSECGKRPPRTEWTSGRYLSNFCPNCGAKMEVEE